MDCGDRLLYPKFSFTSWATHLPSLYLTFLTCKMEMIIQKLPSKFAMRISEFIHTENPHMTDHMGHISKINLTAIHDFIAAISTKPSARHLVCPSARTRISLSLRASLLCILTLRENHSYLATIFILHILYIHVIAYIHIILCYRHMQRSYTH